LSRWILPVTAAALMIGSMAACSKTETATPQSGADREPAVTVSDQWVKATDKGMTGVFGTLDNAGDRDVTVVSASSPTAGSVELHEVVGQAGSGTMRPKDGGFMVPAGGSHVLAPGGDHIMLMDLKMPLKAGSDVEVTLTFDDGTTLPFSAQVRDFPGADEKYEPSE
jgi:copper(I)-binding protein